MAGTGTASAGIRTANPHIKLLSATEVRTINRPATLPEHALRLITDTRTDRCPPTLPANQTNGLDAGTYNTLKKRNMIIERVGVEETNLVLGKTADTTSPLSVGFSKPVVFTVYLLDLLSPKQLDRGFQPHKVYLH